MKGFSIRRYLRLIQGISLLLVFTFILSGCTVLKPLNSFSETCIKAMPNKTFFDDYVNIIERQKAFADESQYGKIDAEKKRREIQREGLLNFQKTLIRYIRSLQTLTSDNIVVNEKEVLFDKLKNAKYPDGTQIFNNKEITAAGALSKLLIKVYTESYRQNQIKEIIASADPHFQILITTLIHFSENYIESLETEKSYTANYYETIIKIAESNPPQQAAITLVRESKNEKLSAIEEKISNAKIYRNIMQKIGDSHKLLNNNIDHIYSEQMPTVIKEHEMEILNLYESISH